MKNRNWFWGILFLLAAAFVVVSQTGSSWFKEVDTLAIIATVILGLIAIQSLLSRNFFGLFLPLALLYLIYYQPLDLPYISPWLLILTAVLASIGFSIIFRVHPHKSVNIHNKCENFNQTTENINDNNPYAKVNFGSSSKYLHSDNLESGQFIVSFGSLEVYFDQAQLSPNGAEIFLDCSFGAIQLYVPKHWQVIDNTHVNLGGVDNDSRRAKPEENAPKLTLTGNVNLGGIEIHYI